MKMQQIDMNYCKLRISLDVFRELGLVSIDFFHSNVKRLPVNGKVNLEDSVLLGSIRQKGAV